MNRDWAKELRGYRLPEGILPLAPCRELFASYSKDALTAAAELGLHFPEKRGVVSHAIRALDNRMEPTARTAVVTIEAHLDGRDVPPAVSNELMKLGFEPDGFAQYEPDHFNTHQTLKFTVAAKSRRWRNELLSFVHHNCQSAFSRVSESGKIEAYIELEVYPRTGRRLWSARPISEQWREKFPLDEHSLYVLTPPCANNGLAPDNLVKKADIHVKIAKEGLSHGTRLKVIERLCQCGFYHVVTWASNDICTAEFLRGRDAMIVFNLMEEFFSRCGGASEMTLECVSTVWRTSCGVGPRRRLASVPPLVIALNGMALQSRAQRPA